MNTLQGYLTRKVAGRIPLWYFLVIAIALGLYLRWRAAHKANPAAPAVDDTTTTDPNFGDTSGFAYPPAPAPTNIYVITGGSDPSQPTGGDSGAPAPSSPGDTTPAPPPVDAPPDTGGSPPTASVADHAAPAPPAPPPPPPVYHPADQPNGYVGGDNGNYATPPAWEPVPTPVDPATGAIARDRNVEGL